MSAELGVTTKVVLSRMDEPLGRCAGNALEVIEAVQCLTGDMSPQISRIVLVLGQLESCYLENPTFLPLKHG